MVSLTGPVVVVPSRPVLIAVTLALGLCAAGGFGFGVLQSLPHKAAALEEQAPIAGHVPPGAVIKDAQPIAEPPPPAPKPKAVKDDDEASDAAASDAAPPPKAAATPAAPAAAVAPPSEAAPGAPPSLTPTAPAKLPDDLPPT
jgi:hypothetical protein